MLKRRLAFLGVLMTPLVFAQRVEVSADLATFTRDGKVPGMVAANTSDYPLGKR